ncbi:tRNA (5-methylaminomethyl-2-thiouridine)(34)-methyltransferase MnmD [Castellaniella sp.]|uniref:tRNA (5-methylaminomethyl-2-thiouridine)(34)-methyltransferase MnmD n=1 Tax=Castellaniella sp. TaxID=1955812 RepID=UPI003568CAAC
MALPAEILTPARWQVDARGVPYHPEFGDVYHGIAGALPQARHVFLQGNHLPERWRRRARFTIGETGFGLGHNFLAAWHAWRHDPQRGERLHYLAFEAHPFHAEDLRHAWRRLPADMQGLAQALAAAWPALLPGIHQIELDQGRVTLTLLFGSIRVMARQTLACVDAFFLDGFAPRRNPEMWRPELFAQLRRLAAEGATVATWCAAGQVRRDLQNAGFLVSRQAGFAGKREMTVARLRPGLGRAGDAPRPDTIAVVGAGLAGSAIAHALALRGHRVHVWDSGVPPSSSCARAPAGAALIPALSPDDDTRSRLSRSGLAHARTRWLALAPAARPLACGALVRAGSPAQAQRQQAALARLQFPASWVCWMDQETASRQAGIPLSFGGLWFAQALRVSPPALIHALLHHEAIGYHEGWVARVAARPAGGWQLLDTAGQVLDQAGQVVLANAIDVPRLLADSSVATPWPVLRHLKPLAGQISLYPSGSSTRPACIVAGQGYGLPPLNGWAVAGSTYRPYAAEARVDADGHEDIRRQLAGWLAPGSLPWLDHPEPQGWAGWRAATRDHLPVIGAVPGPPGLWLACGYGSRGLSWAALAGSWLAARLEGAPEPIERELLRRIRVR